jgi:hypothetical protein
MNPKSSSCNTEGTAYTYYYIIVLAYKNTTNCNYFRLPDAYLKEYRNTVLCYKLIYKNKEGVGLLACHVTGHISSSHVTAGHITAHISHILR